MSQLPEQLTARLEGIRQVLMAHHQASSLLPSAAKGAEREALVRDFLQIVFPATFRFGSGAVTDATGGVSGQLDVVVEFPFFPSFPTPGGTERLYLAESVAFVIEVKSNLIDQWNQVEDSVQKLKPLRRRWRGHASVGANAEITSVAASISWIPYVVVGFDGHKRVDALEERINQTPEDKRPDAALVIKSGAYVGHPFLETRVRVIGAAGLFAFCADGTYLAQNVLAAALDVSAYVSTDKGSDG